MKTSLQPEALYLQLGQLVEHMPDLTAPMTPETNRWLGQAVALVQAVGDMADAAAIKVAAQHMSGDRLLREMNAQTIAAVVHTALAKAELMAPVGIQGAFIPAGGKRNLRLPSRPFAKERSEANGFHKNPSRLRIEGVLSSTAFFMRRVPRLDIAVVVHPLPLGVSAVSLKDIADLLF